MFLTVLLIGSALADIDREQTALFDRVSRSVVFIGAKNGEQKSFGSGFFVSKNGLILTNAHVVGKADTVDVVTTDARAFKARIHARHPSEDIVLLTIDITDAPALDLAPIEDVRIGTWCAAIGHGLGGIWTFTQGMVSNVYRGKANNKDAVIQTQTPVNPGNSGGPLIDRNGRVLGIITAGIKDVQVMNLAIPAAWALAQLSAPPHTQP
jgi:serine protease Do